MSYIAEPQAFILADSISPEGHRLTTMQVTMHRWVLAEFNTHRVFSRNSASSRAIPAHKNVDRVRNQTAYPLAWPEKKSGMQGGDELSDNLRETAIVRWGLLAQRVANEVDKLNELGVHKSVTNRLLEPFLYQTVIVTATEWDNFFYLRDSEMAQPEIAVPAKMMREAYESSEPVKKGEYEWHTPLLQEEDAELIADYVGIKYGSLANREDFERVSRQVSAARCARVSYLTHDGRRDISADVDLYERLTKHGHWSPLEHVATPCWCPPEYDHKGNFSGWDQLRHEAMKND